MVYQAELIRQGAMSETEHPGASHWPKDLESLCPYTLLEWLDGAAQKFLEKY